MIRHEGRRSADHVWRFLDGCGFCYSILRTMRTRRWRSSTGFRGRRGARHAGCFSALLWLMLLMSSWGPVSSTRGLKYSERNAEDIREAPLSSVTLARRRRLLEVFENWLVTQTPLPLLEVCGQPPLLSDVLRAFGWEVFDAGWPKNDYKDVILAVSDLAPWSRPGLTSAWRVVSRWNQLEPETPHVPVPLALFRGTCTVLACWGWTRVLTLMWIGFFALLRPGEICGIRGGDCRKPDDGRGLLIRIHQPKRRVGGARQEYAKLDEEDLPTVVWLVLSKLKRGELLWPSTPQSLVVRWRKALGELVSHPARFTLGSLRSGGATHLFQRWDEDVTRLQWRGRWRVVTTLAHYIQELTAFGISTQWSASVHARIDEASLLLDAVLLDLCEELGADPDFILGAQLSAWAVAATIAAKHSRRRR